MRRLPRILLAGASGIVFGLAYPKTGVWPLAFVGLFPLLAIMSRPEPLPAWAAGLAWGAGFFGFLLRWLYGFFRQYGQLDPGLSGATLALLVAYLSLYPALFATFGALILKRKGNSALGLLPALWVALEWIRGHALSGFPWGLAGYSLVPALPLVQISALTGVYGLSFLVVLVNASIAAWLGPAPKQDGALRLSAATLLILVGALAFGARAMRLPAESGPEVRIGLIQANIPQDQKWSSGQAERILEKHERLTEAAAAQGARIILWPESSSPFPLSRPVSGSPRVMADDAYRQRLEALARRTGASILFGTVDYRVIGGETRALNAAALVRPDATWSETYAKMHLVPFGEYVPLAPVLSFVNRLAQGAIGEFAPGRKPVVTRAGALSIGTLICYETIFPELVGRFPRHGADLLANLTNDAWFGKSSGPHQHLQMSVLRAVENRRYLIRAANTGISAIVDPRGQVIARSRLQETRVILGGVRAVRGQTLYARVGDVFAFLCVILTSAALVAAFAAGRRARREGRLGD
jgi:apolipoprotein N-acyltransferase